MGIIRTAALRHIEALRESVAITLELGALPFTLQGLTPDKLAHWLLEQGVEVHGAVGEPHIRPLMDQHFLSNFDDQVAVLKDMAGHTYAAFGDAGVTRSSGGWSEVPNFVLTSAFVRLLGAAERFELDVLKVLFYYRPSGLLGESADNYGIESPQALQTVAWEEPERGDDNKLIFKKPALWTWLRKFAEVNSERRSIFKNVFGLVTIPPDYKPRQLDDWYDQRNAVAHGRSHVTITLAQYCELEVFVAKLIYHMSTQVKERLMIDI